MAFSSFIQIKWQDGTVPEHGVNGAQMVDVLQVLIARMEYLNNRAPCEENVNMLAALYDAQHWDRLRTERRQAQGVEGTERPHASTD